MQICAARLWRRSQLWMWASKCQYISKIIGSRRITPNLLSSVQSSGVDSPEWDHFLPYNALTIRSWSTVGSWNCLYDLWTRLIITLIVESSGFYRRPLQRSSACIFITLLRSHRVRKYFAKSWQPTKSYFAVSRRAARLWKSTAFSRSWCKTHSGIEP